MFGENMETVHIQNNFFKVPVEVRGWQSPNEEWLCAAAEREWQNQPALRTAPRSPA